jgi:hypothetical protein
MRKNGFCPENDFSSAKKRSAIHINLRKLLKINFLTNIYPDNTQLTPALISERLEIKNPGTFYAKNQKTARYLQSVSSLVQGIFLFAGLV